ncbi:glycosyltransferase family 4 protein [Acidobacteriota bacterium]
MKNENQGKRFCFVMELFFPEIKGGSELQALNIAEELIKRDWEIHYIREKSRFLLEDPIYQGIHLHQISHRHTKMKWLNIFQLYKRMKSIKADFWYCRGTVSYLFPVWICSRFSGGKVVWACSHDDQLVPMGDYGTKRKIIYRVFNSLDKLLFKLALKKTDFILLQSVFQEKTLKEKYRLSGIVIYNGHQIPPASLAERESILLWVGRLSTKKNPEKIVELARCLAPSPIKVIAVGDPMGNEDSLQLFRESEKELDNFEYRDEMEREELYSLVSRASILINTSTAEGFSNTFIEAWMRGVPVFSLNVDPDGLVSEKKLGKVSNSIERMADDIKDLLNDKIQYEKMSRHCRDFAARIFNIQDKVSELVAQITGTSTTGKDMDV